MNNKDCIIIKCLRKIWIDAIHSFASILIVTEFKKKMSD